MLFQAGMIAALAVALFGRAEGSHYTTTEADDCVYDACGAQLMACQGDQGCVQALNDSGVTVVDDCFFSLYVWVYCFTTNCTSLFTNLTDCYQEQCVDCANTTSSYPNSTWSYDYPNSTWSYDYPNSTYSPECVYGQCSDALWGCIGDWNCTLEAIYSGFWNVSDCKKEDKRDGWCGKHECSDKFTNMTDCYVNRCVDESADCSSSSSSSDEASTTDAGGKSGKDSDETSTTEGGGNGNGNGKDSDETSTTGAGEGGANKGAAFAVARGAAPWRACAAALAVAVAMAVGVDGR